jgi:hypothetical protein
LAVYGLAHNLGGGIGVTNATRRHHSSYILRRIGGGSLIADGVELPAYYEPQFNCEMEILRFDSARPNPRYQAWIDDIRAHLLTTPVIRSRYCLADEKERWTQETVGRASLRSSWAESTQASTIC